jgi:hypothetical protein
MDALTSRGELIDAKHHVQLRMDEDGAEALLTKPIDFGTLRSGIDTRVERAA